jgi:hypothetical protein
LGGHVGEFEALWTGGVHAGEFLMLWLPGQVGESVALCVGG